MQYPQYLLRLVSLGIVAFVARAQITCPNGIVVYEKSSATSVSLDTRPDRTVDVSPTEVPTSTCQRVCDGTPSCTAFTVEYGSRTCKVYSGAIEDARLISRPDSAFFEKTCLPDISEMRFRIGACANRLWALERVRGATFNAPPAKLQRDVRSHAICARLCLGETSFECGSAVFDGVARTCALSPEDRRSQPNAFVLDDTKTSDYIENQCINLESKDCRYLPQRDGRVVSVDGMSAATTEEQCRQECNRNTAIVCRSYSYKISGNKCYLSSDDSVSLQGVEVAAEEGIRYAERRCRPSGINAFPPGTGSSLYQQGGILMPGFSVASANLSPQSYLSNPNMAPNYFGGSGNVHAYGQQYPSQVPLNRFSPTPGYAPVSQTPYVVRGDAANNANPNYNPFGYGQSGSPGQFGVNPNYPSFDNNRGYPGLNQFQPEVADPRVFNMFRDVYANGNNNGFNSFTSPERCTFEKSTGLAVVADPRGPIPVNSFGSGITSQCVAWCRFQGPTRCPAFILDYTRNECSVLSRPADVALAPGAIQGQSYFEQVCFTNEYRACEGKSWAFERFVHFELRGFDDRVLSSVGNVRDCEEACLKETQFACISAEYDSSRFECRLSRENRLSRPYAFQQAPSVDYLENQCVPPTTLSTCSPLRQDGEALLYADAILGQVFTEDECRRFCQTFPNFTCNAASYRQTANECSLSSGVTTVRQPDAILLFTSCSQPNLVTATFNNNNNIGQSQIPNSVAGQQFPTSFNTFQFVPQQQPSFIPNQFTSGYAGFSSAGQSPPSFNQAFQPQNPQFFNGFVSVPMGGVQYGLQPQQPFFNGQQFPSTAAGARIPAGQTPSDFQGAGQFGQQFPVTGQFPGYGQFPTATAPGQFSNAGGGFAYQSNFPPNSFNPASQPNFPGPPPSFPFNDVNLSTSGQSSRSSSVGQNPSRSSYNDNISRRRGSRLRSTEATSERARPITAEPH